MEIYKLDEMFKGWFVGDFEPTIVKTGSCELGIKHYKMGTIERAHYHKEAEELTAVVVGRVRMNNSIYNSGDIIKVLKNEVIEFEALEDSITIVFKTASVKEDKYFVDE
jgi:hypothetical protein